MLIHTTITVWRGTEYIIRDFKFEKYTKKFELNTDIKNIILFEIRVPEDAKKSYIGRLSKYYWEIDVKLDIEDGNDVHIKSVIEII